MPEEDSWEERKIFDVIWLRSKGWGTNTKTFDTTNRDKDLQPCVIKDTLLTMIWASTNNQRHMFSKIPASGAEPGLVPAGPLPPTRNDQQQAFLQSIGLGSDISNNGDDNDGSILS